MKILATVDFGKNAKTKRQTTVTAFWELVETQQNAMLTIAIDHQGKKFLVPVDKTLINDLGGQHSAEKTYAGTAKAADGFLLDIP
jgi:predicted ABC-type sugar transport system permease subunit